MSSASWELQKSIYTALAANGTLTALLSGGAAGIVDGPSVDQALPYVDLGEIEERDFSTKSFVGGDHFITIHAWSEQAGKKEIADIFQQVKTSLNRVSLSVAANQLIDLMFDNSRIFMDSDGTTRHGILEFRALTVED